MPERTASPAALRRARPQDAAWLAPLSAEHAAFEGSPVHCDARWQQRLAAGCGQLQ